MSPPPTDNNPDHHPPRWETAHHRLIVPADGNHHGTLFAGSLLRLALECAYATGHRAMGQDANIVLRDVLHLDCHRPVPIGAVVDIRGAVLHVRGPYLVVGLLGTPLPDDELVWMDALMGFVQVGGDFRPEPLPFSNDDRPPLPGYWQPLIDFLGTKPRRGPAVKKIDPSLFRRDLGK